MLCRFLLFLVSCIYLLGTAAAEVHQKVLYLSAANAANNWTAIESFSDGTWSIAPVNLEGFGETMFQRGFQAALEEVEDKLRLLMRLLNPNIVIVASKGLNVLTYLASMDIYNGPTILLSPIPNKCDHIHGNNWKDQWTNSMKVLRDKVVGPIGIGIGTSSDEQSIIVDMMNETLVCGETFEETNGQIFFQHCPAWFLRSFPGDHGWKNQDSNAINIASLIIRVLNSMDEAKKTKVHAI
mmetsp:Transcript_16204/g.23822  ORF Transcript_16204/g.23822 Transcript_16204/m.23822 type:complete len:239 (+) Transcript_16204:40-756(+)|eukprot:CAMPEP_0194230950 /NCGR_PEP_ID=MMETSP0156-20130528/44668_1 /TAXON_ID=33649 /ORGANISM="Thalassionema nitzschioides, Strain L26-B" /LENGTH=238 /DNA_ID=CAMNT_0038963551 /DNA_START=33 /DNA_END=749 /DNA_ORIENTATION=-